jgi:hypothetical protein
MGNVDLLVPLHQLDSLALDHVLFLEHVCEYGWKNLAF